MRSVSSASLRVRRDKTFSTTRNGMVIVNVDLNKSVKDADEFWSKLRLDMAQLKATELPAGVLGPIVDSDFGDTVAVLIAVHGGNYGPRELKDYAQTVETALRAIPAVSKIKRIGDQKEEIDIGTSSERLAQYGVNPHEGDAGARKGATLCSLPAACRPEQSKVPIESGGRLQTEDQIRQVMVDVSPDRPAGLYRRPGHSGAGLQRPHRICPHRRRAGNSAGGRDARGQQHCGLRQHAAQDAEGTCRRLCRRT